MMTLEALMPPCPLMAVAWRGCLSWAVTEPEIVAAFVRDTGARPPSPLDRMIDAATGAGDATGLKFVQWFNENVWGDITIAAGDDPPNPDGATP